MHGSQMNGPMVSAWRIGISYTMKTGMHIKKNDISNIVIFLIIFCSFKIPQKFYTVDLYLHIQ